MTLRSGGGALAFLQRHPVVCLLLLSPGIPEYISGSSPLNAIVLHPPMFLFQAVANLGLYGPGVLLVREAMVRWRKGWASVLLLGAAYGILEEGIALSTLFDPKANPVGKLGVYGHWLGVNWIWSAGILPVHMIFSISLPILLLGLAVPSTRGRSLLDRRGLAAVSLILGLDVTFLFLLVFRTGGFWMGWNVFVSSLLAIGLLVLAARRIPADALHTTTLPRLGARQLALLGALFYLSVLLTEGLGMDASLPAAADLAAVVAVEALFLLATVQSVGSQDNERGLIALALGLVLPIAAIGVISELRLPLTLLPTTAFVLFLRGLWAQYPVRTDALTGSGGTSA
ncbi:MAG TPA: hypothetical protein VLU99_02435 [Nitrososphaerales archaeon]|nr:hypothetical protein [Nitrososphaerales archaeon]HUK74622.1 hypothetical protein [Nitrososphaerales archaeon]